MAAVIQSPRVFPDPAIELAEDVHRVGKAMDTNPVST
jgi:hypothetical protein